MSKSRKETKFKRTVIKNQDGTLQTARINTVTGEIKAFRYKDSIDNTTLPKAKPGREITERGIDYVPHWELIPPPNHVTVIGDSKKIKVTKLNENNIYLQDYLILDDAVTDIPVLDNLINGTIALDSGNSRPIGKGLLFSMLRDLDEINKDTIQAYTGYSESYCYKLAQYLRVLSLAFDREVEG